MIAPIITAINDALHNYEGDIHSIRDKNGDVLPSRILGLVRPAYSSSEKHFTLFVPGQPYAFSGDFSTDFDTEQLSATVEQPITDDDALGWLSMHTTAGVAVDSEPYTQTYGSYQQTSFRFQMRFILLSRDPSAIGRAMMTLPTVPGVRLYGTIEDNAPDIMKKYLGFGPEKQKSIDPGLWAWAIPYQIEGVSNDDIRAFYAELTPQATRYTATF
ncbi:hypothetical protein FAES_1841 [Fibrella aestuarina BUZ 2]|uniref:Uncharacterized protein n=1 Tax=Fibrella aestuarina BUZ 2 TaxID=1166018 RepID=I0K6U8_9BACT|nr:hypothetical protein [Fibrella aestuarina]CCG99851.1 hypothetical protein FAES_1841 [Fibrella aestuarina BUZ 2]